MRGPNPRSARRAYRSSRAVSLFPPGRSSLSPVAGGDGDARGTAVEAGGAAMELQSRSADRRPGLAARAAGSCSSGPRAARCSVSPPPPANYKSHKAVQTGLLALVVRLTRHVRDVVRAQKDPAPRFNTNSAAQSPWKKNQ